MKFAVITLNPVDPACRRALADRERLHAIIAASCGARPLWHWRDDRIRVVSDRICEDRLAARLGRPVIHVTDYDPLLDSLHEGDLLTVDVDANMTVCRDGRRLPLTDDMMREQWTRRTCARNGLDARSIMMLDHDVDMADAHHRRLTIDHATVRIEAIVADADKTRRMLTTGVGRARAFGFGLPLIARRIPADVSSDTSQGAAL